MIGLGFSLWDVYTHPSGRSLLPEFHPRESERHAGTPSGTAPPGALGSATPKIGAIGAPVALSVCSDFPLPGCGSDLFSFMFLMFYKFYSSFFIFI